MSPDLSDYIRYSGITLQLAGFVMTALNIRTVRSDHTHRRGMARAVIDGTRDTLRRLTRRPRTTVMVHSVDAAVSRETARPVRVRRHATHLEDRIGELERVAREQDQRQDELEGAIDRESYDRQAGLDAERRARERGHRGIEAKIERLADLDVNMPATVGVIAFSFGVVFTGAPEEIAAVLRLAF